MSRILHDTLVASTVKTITLVTPYAGTVEVTNVSGVAAVYFTVDGTTPTVAGPDTEVLPAVAGASMIVPGRHDGTQIVVKLISSGTPTVSAAAR